MLTKRVFFAGVLLCLMLSSPYECTTESVSTNAPATTQNPTTSDQTTTNPTTAGPTTTTLTTKVTSAQTEVTTSVTTQSPKTTTAPPSQAPVLSYSVDNCLRANFSLSFNIPYIKTDGNASITYLLQNYTSYSGECNSTYNTLNITFADNWFILLNYTMSNSVYQLEKIQFNYVVDAKNFPNATNLGSKSELKANLSDFSTNKDNSYKCTSETSISLDTVKVDFANYQAQPFSSGKKDFDTAVECPADLAGTSKLVPIIVGSALAVLVILVLIAYIVGRRKHRPGYQQV